MKKEQSLKTFLVPRLRRLSFMWPARNKAKQLARVERGKYKCAKCNNIFGPKEIALDHITPIVSVEGFTDWNDYVEGLFCKTEGYQILCHQCHSEKTEKENTKRQENKNKS